MMDPATAYFLKKYYPHVIKWWLVVYNPESVRIWHSKAEREEALRLKALEEAETAKIAAEKPTAQPETPALVDSASDSHKIDDSAYNAATGSYSGLYGQKPVDDDTQAALEAILKASSNQTSVDTFLASTSASVTLPPEQDEIIKEANEIYERLLREAAEDEARKQAEIEEMRKQAELTFAQA
ncbi:MAG: hypothetical protein K2P63_08075 [Lachnospiraceae bacterium]|nr:hypothetical protein [Lachnospiraceae bacterium]